MTFWKRFFTSIRCIFDRDYTFIFIKPSITTICVQPWSVTVFSRMFTFQTWQFPRKQCWLNKWKCFISFIHPALLQFDMFVQICLLLAHPFFVRAKTKTWKSVFNFKKPARHVIKTCNVCLTSMHSFMLQTKHFHWFSQHSCLGNCHVWKVNIHEKTVTLHGWTQMVV